MAASGIQFWIQFSSIHCEWNLKQHSITIEMKMWSKAFFWVLQSPNTTSTIFPWSIDGNFHIIPIFIYNQTKWTWCILHGEHGKNNVVDSWSWWLRMMMIIKIKLPSSLSLSHSISKCELLFFLRELHK